MKSPRLSDEIDQTMCLLLGPDHGYSDEDEQEFASEYDDPMLILELKERERGIPASKF